MKTKISSLYKKNNIISNIINSMTDRNDFLLIGHKNPDEDCIASTVALSLLLSKFNKNVVIYQKDKFQEQLEYLFKICRFNQIEVVSEERDLPDRISTIFTCDTPKPDMLDSCERINRLLAEHSVRVIELDHHLGSDSEYIGHEGYRLVDQASSTCELVGILGYKINKQTDLLEQYQISNLLTRNIVVAILTGVVGDSRMGSYLKSRREKRYFRFISTMYSNLLMDATTNEANISNMQEIFEEIQRLSEVEERCYNYLIEKKQFSPSIGYIVLHKNDIDYIDSMCDNKALSSVSKRIADNLADESQKLGLTVFHDNTKEPGFYQFKLRRSRNFQQLDLREILNQFSIENGGGHEGAVGFRFPKDKIENLDKYVDRLINGIEARLKSKKN